MLKKIQYILILLTLSVSVSASTNFSDLLDTYKEEKRFKQELQQGNLSSVEPILSAGKLYLKYGKNLGIGKSEYNSVQKQEFSELTASWDSLIQLNSPLKFRDSHDSFRCKSQKSRFIVNELKEKLTDRGLYWLGRAIANGRIEEMSTLIELYQFGDIEESCQVIELVQSMTENDLAQNRYIQFFIGYLSLYGIILKQDLHQAITFLEQAKNVDINQTLYYLARAKTKLVLNKYTDNIVKNDSIEGDYRDAQTLYNHQQDIDLDKYNEILYLYQQAAEYDNVYALIYLSYYYRQQDNDRANYYFELASNTTNPQNILILAKWYEWNEQYQSAIDVYKKLAENQPSYYLQVAKIYIKMEKQYHTSLVYKIIDSYEAYLAEVNDPEIQLKLSDLYQYSTVDDIPKQMYWLEVAAKNDYIKAQYQLANEYLHGNSDYNPNYKKALYWFEQACNNQFSAEEDYISAYCQAFLELKQQPDLQKTANAGDKDAQYKLGVILAKHRYFKDIAQYYLINAANQGHQEAEMMERINSLPQYSFQ